MSKKLLLCTIAAAVLGFSAQAAMAQNGPVGPVGPVKLTVAAHAKVITSLREACGPGTDQACVKAIADAKTEMFTNPAMIKAVTPTDVNVTRAACASGTSAEACAVQVKKMAAKYNFATAEGSNAINAKVISNMRENCAAGPVDACVRAVNALTNAPA